MAGSGKGKGNKKDKNSKVNLSGAVLVFMQTVHVKSSCADAGHRQQRYF